MLCEQNQLPTLSRASRMTGEELLGLPSDIRIELIAVAKTAIYNFINRVASNMTLDFDHAQAASQGKIVADFFHAHARRLAELNPQIKDNSINPKRRARQVAKLRKRKLGIK